ncbi:MAG: hypothetical protein ACLFVW_09160, partial [Phycisphaerae bacterium]
SFKIYTMPVCPIRQARTAGKISPDPRGCDGKGLGISHEKKPRAGRRGFSCVFATFCFLSGSVVAGFCVS